MVQGWQGHDGNCTVFSKVRGSRNHSGVAISGGVNTGRPVLWPSWPASSPWVTAVGATRIAGAPLQAVEVASSAFGSGGGFSRDFSQHNASWEAAAVADYLSRNPPGLPPNGSFPGRTGRATPDVAALGEGFQVFNGGQLLDIGGTSASAPLFAGLISLLNEARMERKLPQLGFLNPWLYKHAGCLTDIVNGTNAISRDGTPLRYGFSCSRGWDPVSGLGTPMFDKMLQAALPAMY